MVYCLETSLNLGLLDIDKGWVLNLGSIQQNDDPKSFFRGPGGPCPFGQTFYFNTNNFRKGTVKAQNFLPIYFSGPGPRPCAVSLQDRLWKFQNSPKRKVNLPG